MRYLLLALSALFIACSRPQSTGHHKRIIQRYYGEVWNQGKLDVLDELLDKQYINHTPSVPNPPPGPGGLKPIVAAIRKAFPDLHYEIKDIIISDSMAVARVIMTGTQHGWIQRYNINSSTIRNSNALPSATKNIKAFRSYDPKASSFSRLFSPGSICDACTRDDGGDGNTPACRALPGNCLATITVWL